MGFGIGGGKAWDICRGRDDLFVVLFFFFFCPGPGFRLFVTVYAIYNLSARPYLKNNIRKGIVV